MLGFNRMDIIRRLVLLITAVLIGWRCIFPVEYRPGRRGPMVVSVEKTVFQCIGIAIIGGVLFYILGDKKKEKD